MGAPSYERSSPRDLVYDVATAKNPDGSKYKLDIATNTLVTKVNFDTTGEKPKATGVDYLFGESLYRANPRASLTEDGGIPGSVSRSREAILYDGTFNTPQILKLSGVGPADELEKFNVPVIKNLPGMGTNLQDKQTPTYLHRYELGVTAEVSSDFVLVEKCCYLADGDECYDQYINGEGALKGPYTIGGLAVGYFMTSSQAEGEHDIWVGGLPAIDEIRPLDGSSFTQVWPPRNVTDDDAALREWIAEEAWGHHASCLCPIGADGDPMAVLDSSFRVRGIDGLRVVDASAFPKVVGTFPVLSIYLMSEKSADVILADLAA
ncbi:choline dehydrogenase [Apiospora phragmitis]|uniref:Choline dehydrogenase n=1 Tax=Apiospora phragmitis TaxID=2905665 RepID=A0ABR1X522_9PEZI